MKNKNLTPLVIEAQKGNKKALNDLIESCYNDIYYFALKTVKKEDIAADVTQDACLKIIQSLGKLQDPAAFKSWALQITYNFCAMHFRKTKDVLVDENEDGETVFDTLADDSEDAQPDKAYENAEFKQMMRDMIESLPAEQASALMLYYYEKASVKEIAEIHGVSMEEVTPAMRRAAKATNFGIVYGISGFGLARNAGLSRKEADQFIQTYFQRYPGVRAFMDECVRLGNETGYAQTMHGRRRELYELRSSNRNVRNFGERAAMNTPVQGTAADIIKLAMVKVSQRLRDEGYAARLILQVHDELVVECPMEEADAVSALLQQTMEQIVSLDVPLVAEVSRGKDWDAAH